MANRPSRVEVLLMAVGTVYVLVAGWLVLRPVPNAPRAGVSWFRDWLDGLGVHLSSGEAEFLCNIALLIPFPLLAGLVFRRVHWGTWVVLAYLASVGVEIIQAVALPHRSGSMRDIVANTGGAALGGLLLWAMRSLKVRYSREQFQ